MVDVPLDEANLLTGLSKQLDRLVTYVPTMDTVGDVDDDPDMVALPPLGLFRFTMEGAGATLGVDQRHALLQGIVVRGVELVGLQVKHPLPTIEQGQFRVTILAREESVALAHHLRRDDLEVACAQG